MTTNQMQGPIVQKVEDLQPAYFFTQNITRGRNLSGKFYKITPLTSLSDNTQRKSPRLVFRTGTFRARRVNKKVVLKLLGVDDCLYILYFEKLFHAESIMEFLDATNNNLAVARDVHLYLETGTLTHAQTESSSSQFDAEHPRTLPLADWLGTRSRGGQDSSQNVQAGSDDQPE